MDIGIHIKKDKKSRN